MIRQRYKYSFDVSESGEYWLSREERLPVFKIVKAITDELNLKWKHEFVFRSYYPSFFIGTCDTPDTAHTVYVEMKSQLAPLGVSCDKLVIMDTWESLTSQEREERMALRLELVEHRQTINELYDEYLIKPFSIIEGALNQAEALLGKNQLSKAKAQHLVKVIGCAIANAKKARSGLAVEIPKTEADLHDEVDEALFSQAKEADDNGQEPSVEIPF